MIAKLKKDLEKYAHLKLNAANILKNNRLEAALDYLFVASTYAWTVNLGILSDDELENLLSKSGECIKEERNVRCNNNQRTQGNVKTIAHAVSFLNDVGGHSEILRQWIEILGGLVEKQYLYVTNVSNVPTRYSYLDDLAGQGVCIRQLPYNSLYTDRIRKLVGFIEEDSPDILILYINPNDVVAVAALSAIADKPRVVFFNHADHIFWLGKSVIDLLIDFRNVSVKYSTSLRGIDPNRIRLIPLTTNIQPRKVCRDTYGVPEDSTLSVSVGSYYKVAGGQEPNYFEMINELLARFPNHYHLFVTDYPDQAEQQYASAEAGVSRRFISTGPLADLAPVYGVADFLIETFPLCGCTVRVEAMACGVPVVAFRNRKYDLLSECDALPPDYPFRFSTEGDAIEYCSAFIREPKLRNRIGAELYTRYNKKMNHERICDLWKDILEDKVPREEDASSEDGTRQRNAPNGDHVYSWREEIGHSRSASPFSINRHLLGQSLVKQSEFTFRDRLRFCRGNIRNFLRWGYGVYRRRREKARILHNDLNVK